MGSLHFLLPLGMVILGFLGAGLAGSPRIKVWSWLLFQAGWFIALLQLEPPGGAMTFVLGGLFSVISLVLFGVLWTLARRVPPSGAEASKIALRKASK